MVSRRRGVWGARSTNWVPRKAKVRAAPSDCPTATHCPDGYSASAVNSAEPALGTTAEELTRKRQANKTTSGKTA